MLRASPFSLLPALLLPPRPPPKPPLLLLLDRYLERLFAEESVGCKGSGVASNSSTDVSYTTTTAMDASGGSGGGGGGAAAAAAFNVFPVFEAISATRTAQ